MKKTIALLLMIALLISIAGCATPQPPATQQPATTPAPPAQDPEPTEAESPAQRTVTDQLGREVILPETVTRVAASHGPMISMIVAMGGADLVVGVNQIRGGRNIFDVVAPNVMEATQIGHGLELNLEELANVNPDLFVLSTRHSDLLADLETLGIAAVAINPESFESIITAMRIVGVSIDREEYAEEIIAAFEQQLAFTRERVALSDYRPTAIVAGGGVTTVAANGMIQTAILEIAGAVNAAAEVEGTSNTEVSLEQILEWNPQYIFITAWGALQPEDFLNEPRFQELDAVVNGNVHKFPSDADWWDIPSSASALGAMWAAHLLHPEVLTADELDAAVEDFYYLLYGQRLGREYFGY